MNSNDPELDFVKSGSEAKRICYAFEAIWRHFWWFWVLRGLSIIIPDSCVHKSN